MNSESYLESNEGKLEESEAIELEILSEFGY